MEYERELKILEELKNKIRNENDIQKQTLLICNYFNIVAYLEQLNIINAIDYVDDLNVDLSRYFDELLNGRLNYCNEFLGNFLEIQKINSNIIKLYRKYPLKKRELEYCNPINIHEGMDLLYDFFGSLSDEFYQIFKNMVLDSRISTMPSICEEGLTYNVGKDYGQYIIIRDGSKIYDFEFISALAHEIGHCYEFNLTNNNQRIMPLYLFAEVASLFIEKLFKLYNIENDLYKKETIHSEMVWQGILKQRVLVNHFTNKCLIANTGIKLNGYDLDFKDYDNVKAKCFINKTNQKAIKEMPPSLENYLYVIGDFIANNFIEIYKQNDKECLELLKRFLLNSKTTPVSTNLKTFGTSYIETEKVIKQSYEFQKGLKR